MKRLKTQFGVFFALLAGLLGFLLYNSYRQMALEERAIWEGNGERVYNQMQAVISDFLNREDERSFSEYRYYQALPGGSQQALSLSPLAAVPASDPMGLLGYFQIDSDGAFASPYLPPDVGSVPAGELAKRRAKENELKALTKSLKIEAFAENRTARDETGTGSASEKESGAFAARDDDLQGQAAFPLTKGAAKNVYPNPVQEQKASLAKLKKEDFFREKAEAEKKQKDSKAEVSQLARRQLAPSLGQSQAFEAQSSLPVKPGGFGGGGRAAPDQLVPAEAPSLLVDPFQARLVEGKVLLFYRKLWLNQKLYLQGFAVELKTFFGWAMEQSFLNSDLAPFAKAQLDFGGAAVEDFNPAKLADAALKPLFRRDLGYPLNRFSLAILAGELPRFSARSYLDLFTLLLVLLVTGGLYLIYRSAAAAVQLSQKRQDFVSAVTHELKTPLTSIRMYSEMLEDGWVKDAGKRQEYYRHLSKESGRLSGLIDNVLQLARLEKQTYKLQLKRAAPGEDCEEWARELDKLAEVRGFRLHFSQDGDLPAISYDPEALKQVLLILLDNSIKFGAESDKTLEWSLSKSADGVALLWSDRGPGIPRQELRKVFEKFYRVENELTRKTHGTGIGLAMAKIIVESMGGKIEALPREGGGLTVRIAFPPAKESKIDTAFPPQ